MIDDDDVVNDGDDDDDNDDASEGYIINLFTIFTLTYL